MGTPLTLLVEWNLMAKVTHLCTYLYCGIMLTYVSIFSALKIQMSSQSYDILSNHGGFEIQAREGLIDMKVWK